MSTNKNINFTLNKTQNQQLKQNLDYLKLRYISDNYESYFTKAAKNNWSHADFLANLINGEASLHKDRSIQRKISLARFPVIKTLEQFSWSWPKKINRMQVENLFRLKFIEDKSNVIFLGGVGLGKSHLSSAIGYSACLAGHTVLFTTAIDVINNLIAAKNAGRLKNEIRKYVKPSLLVLDEL